MFFNTVNSNDKRESWKFKSCKEDTRWSTFPYLKTWIYFIRCFKRKFKFWITSIFNILYVQSNTFNIQVHILYTLYKFFKKILLFILFTEYSFFVFVYFLLVLFSHEKKSIVSTIFEIIQLSILIPFMLCCYIKKHKSKEWKRWKEEVKSHNQNKVTNSRKKEIKEKFLAYILRGFFLRIYIKFKNKIKINIEIR